MIALLFDDFGIAGSSTQLPVSAKGNSLIPQSIGAETSHGRHVCCRRFLAAYSIVNASLWSSPTFMSAFCPTAKAFSQFKDRRLTALLPPVLTSNSSQIFIVQQSLHRARLSLELHGWTATRKRIH